MTLSTILLDIFAITGCISLCLLMLAISIGILSYIWNIALDKYLTLHTLETKGRLIAQIEQIVCWCCYDFPILKDVGEYLIKGLTIGGYFENVSQFRAKLREKYGERK